MTYDPHNIFAKILRQEIPCNKVYEDEYVLAFHDIAPKASVHILVIPKGPYESFDAFTKAASTDEIVGFYQAVQKITEEKSIVSSGYRLLVNHGQNGGQEVPHFHLHIVGGEKLGPMIAK